MNCLSILVFSFLAIFRCIQYCSKQLFLLVFESLECPLFLVKLTSYQRFFKLHFIIILILWLSQHLNDEPNPIFLVYNWNIVAEFLIFMLVCFIFLLAANFFEFAFSRIETLYFFGDLWTFLNQTITVSTQKIGCITRFKKIKMLSFEAICTE